jgi:two-component system, cell cycle sensor histidine kinase and response regulator CckA
LLRTQKIKSVGVLAGGIAHDFNNLLTGILGNISLAKLFAGRDEHVIKFLTEAEKACLRATTLTQQLLTFAKGGAPVRQTVSITELLRESTLFALRGANVRADLMIAEDLWSVDADTGQINQVIHNVVLNAAQAMPDGGIVAVRADNLVVDTGSELPLQEGRYLKIAITDHGYGIPADILPHIFDPYFTTKAHGSGLGLASAYAIVTKHDGYITAASEVGVGTTFSIYLPAAQHPIPPVQEEAVTPSSGTNRILVMDDEESIREMLHELLTILGYAVVCTQDGAEASAAYQRAQAAGQPFDAVILDITVPGRLGGKETIAQLRMIDPQVKALISSGYAQDPILANFAQYGFRGVLTKPYTMERLHGALQRIIQGRSG